MSSQQIIQPVVDLLGQPDGPRERQLIWGEQVTVEGEKGGWSQVIAAKDGYTGYVPNVALGAPAPTTHWVSALATHVYTQPDFKSADLRSLSFGSRVQVLSQGDRFTETSEGFIPSSHLSPLETQMTDPVAVAEVFLGTPYLWGGNSRLGIDCSGLVQASLLACGIPCPGDSGPQERALGNYASPKGSNYLRGDLLFWKGHVAFVRDSETLIHANAFHMAVAVEPLQPAIDRILAQGDGPVTAHKRLT
ncbi:NLP/P60 hydrolase [Parasedimentitalea marina]|uniref:NLP/P60 hydrolase n=1 Tax=Parasedimentitalea marina TaxID=2483033 RepID=A0A3T0MXL7_9RHOB|nr:NlpC/P60 family protein [Parasedimentitalea marina]AZV76499.1 NLP/P60 hydrolase [Parasedimentitalea marina]